MIRPSLGDTVFVAYVVSALVIFQCSSQDATVGMILGPAECCANWHILDVPHGTLPGLGHPQHARPRAGGVSRSGVAASFGRSQRSTAAGPSGAGFGRTGAEDKLLNGWKKRNLLT